MVELVKNVNYVEVENTSLIEDVISRTEQQKGKYPYKGCKEKILHFAKDHNNTVQKLDIELFLKYIREHSTEFPDYNFEVKGNKNYMESIDDDIAKYCCGLFYRYYKQKGMFYVNEIDSLPLLEYGDEKALKTSAEVASDPINIENIGYTEETIKKLVYDIYTLSLIFQVDLFSILDVYNDRIGRIELKDIPAGKVRLIDNYGNLVKVVTDHVAIIKYAAKFSMYTVLNKNLKHETETGLEYGDKFYNIYNVNWYLTRLKRLCRDNDIELDIKTIDDVKLSKQANIEEVTMINRGEVINVLVNDLNEKTNEILNKTRLDTMNIESFIGSWLGGTIKCNKYIKDIPFINDSVPFVIPSENLINKNTSQSINDALKSGNFLILNKYGLGISIQGYDLDKTNLSLKPLNLSNINEVARFVRGTE